MDERMKALKAAMESEEMKTAFKRFEECATAEERREALVTIGWLMLTPEERETVRLRHAST